MQKLFYILAILIIYGSLYPFNFTVDESTSIQELLNRNLVTSIPDIFGNIILMIPLGAAGIFTFNKQSLFQRVLLTAVISVVLAFLVQVAQIYIPGRDAALSDVFWNSTGIIIGISLGIFIESFLKKQTSSPHKSITFKTSLPVFLIGLWLFWQLVPFIPSLDIYYLKASIKGLWLKHELSIPQFLYIGSTTLLLGQLLSTLLDKTKVIKALAVLILLTLFGKVIIITQVLNLATIIGLLTGLTGWILLSQTEQKTRSIVMVLCMLVSYSLMSLQPFQFSHASSSFNFVPFAGLLDGSMLTNTSALAEKLFAYISILWLSQLITGQLTRWAIALALWVTFLEYIQTWLPGRVASISEPIWVLLAAWILNTLLNREKLSMSSSTIKTLPLAEPQSEPLNTNHPDSSSPYTWLRSWQARFILICLGLAILLNMLLGLPGIPYNVKELFYNKGHFIALLVFVLSLLWFGIASGWLAKNLARKHIPIIATPLYSIMAAIISYYLMSNAVSYESMSDIVGSSNLYKQIVEDQIWGHWGRLLFEGLTLDDLASSLEQGFRYVALVSPLFMLFMLAIQLVDRSLKVTISQLIINTLLTIPWIILCKAIVFDWAVTDNLTELVAASTPYGISGTVFLYLLLLLASLNAAIIARPVSKRPFAILLRILATLVAIPAGWLLLNQGLESIIIKHDSVYSAIQFLLGPDRKQLLSNGELFFRWSLVYSGFIAVLTTGLKFSTPFSVWVESLGNRTLKSIKPLIKENTAKQTRILIFALPAVLIVGALSLFLLSQFKVAQEYQLPELSELPSVYLPNFKTQHPRLPAPTDKEIQKLLQQNQQFFNQHRFHAKRGKLYSQILIAYAFPGDIDLNKLYKKLMALEFTGRGNVQTKPIAQAYDWLYAQWSPKQRQQLRNKVKQACDYQIKIIRDEMKLSPYNVFLYNSPFQALVAASLALHKDIPESEDSCMRFTYDYWANRVVPVWKQVMGKNGGWHEGGEYIGIGIGQAIYQVPAMWRAATGEDYFKKIPGIRGFLDFLVYRTRPDDTHFRWGDAGFFDRIIPDRLALAIEFGHKAAYNIRPPSKIVPTSWPWGPLTEPSLIDKHANQALPLTKIFDGIGLLVSRSSWNKDATYVTFKAGDNYWSHSHLDQGSFTIFKGGALAIDSGLYGPKYGSDHHLNYTYQSIAHNIVTVTDPADTVPMTVKKKKGSKKQPPPREIANDGGQRRVGSGWGKSAPLDLQDWLNQSDIYHTASLTRVIEKDNVIMAIANLTPAYTNSLSGEGTFAHRTRRVKQYQRVFVYDKNNDLIIIFDKINAYKSSFRKKWLLHSLQEPLIKNNFFAIQTPANPKTKMPGGSLKGQILLPKKALINKIGGKGMAFYVDGVNYDEKGQVLKIEQRKRNVEPGHWRLEVEPSASHKEDLFLVAMQPSLLENNKPLPKITAYKKGQTVYCEISGKWKLKITFAQDLSNSNFQSTF